MIFVKDPSDTSQFVGFGTWNTTSAPSNWGVVGRWSISQFGVFEIQKGSALLVNGAFGKRTPLLHSQTDFYFSWHTTDLVVFLTTVIFCFTFPFRLLGVAFLAGCFLGLEALFLADLGIVFWWFVTQISINVEIVVSMKMRFFEQNVLKQKNEIICSVRYKKITALENFKDFDDSKIVKLSAPKRGVWGRCSIF